MVEPSTSQNIFLQSKPQDQVQEICQNKYAFHATNSQTVFDWHIDYLGRKSQKRRTSTASGYAGSTHKIFCTICHRGNSPQNNRIVLCDKCDRPFHQQCHMPPIESITLEIEGTTWFCNQCESERESRLVVKHELDGRNIEKETKMAYLLSLPKSFLIDMIFSYERNYPGLKMYPSNLRSERVRRDSLSGSPPRRADMIDSHDDDGSGYNLDDVPSYEDMIEKALIAIGDPRGSSPRSIWEWMGRYLNISFMTHHSIWAKVSDGIFPILLFPIRNYPLAEAFPRSASQSLQKAVKKGRFFKEGSCYKMNPNYIPEPKVWYIFLQRKSRPSYLSLLRSHC